MPQSHDLSHLPHRIGLIATWALALVLAIAAAAKVFTPSTDTFIYFSNAFSTRPSFDQVSLALILVAAAEGVLAILLLTRTRPRLTLTAISLLVLTWLIIVAFANKTDCGCFGDLMTLTPEAHFTLLVSMAALCVLSFLSIRPNARVSSPSR